MYADLWGKAQPDADQGAAFHPLVYHSLDVGAVCAALLEAQPHWLSLLAARARLPQEICRAWLITAACLHDLGKFAPGFQAKGPEALAIGQCVRAACPGVVDSGHPLAGAALASYWMSNQDAPQATLKIEDDDTAILFGTWLRAACGHHGRPAKVPLGDVTLSQLKTFWGLSSEMGKALKLTAHHFTDDVIALMARQGYDIAYTAKTRRQRARAEWLVIGLINLADWVGSDKAFFPYTPYREDEDWDVYWHYAKAQAHLALKAKGLSICDPSEALGLPDLLGVSADQEVIPTALQAWAQTVEVTGLGPHLAIIEDFTGAGKTEASLLLAHKMMQTGSAHGLYWGLPTQATANGLYRRFMSAIPHLFAPESHPSLILAHGGRDMNLDFQNTLKAGDRRLAAYREAEDKADLGEIPAEAECAVWLSEDRRTTFFADVGVGTIDQALLGAMPSKFAVLRQLGLSQKVLIIDEAHAYDAYTNRLLENLIGFQAALGGSVIILTATLSTQARHSFVKAFLEGVQSSKSGDLRLENRGFPYAGLISFEGEDFSKVETAFPFDEHTRGTRRDTPIRFFADPEAGEAALLERAKAGFNGVYIRNTVKDALASYHRLKAKAGAKITVRVFHARFTRADRSRIERAVMADFGKGSTPEQRAGQILITTQVVEQSLDVDFDYLISDLAPLDLLIQRAGRLHRHSHRPTRPDPELWIVSPDPDDVPAEGQWLNGPFISTGWVYRNHARLWVGMRDLKRAGALCLQSENPRDLLDRVYDYPQDDIPSSLHESLQSQEGEAKGARAMAGQIGLDVDQGYQASVSAEIQWDPDRKLSTRLDKAITQTFRLARWERGRLVPFHDEAQDPKLAWRYSELNLRTTQCLGPDFDKIPDAQIVQALQAQWDEHRIDAIVLPLVETSEGWAVDIICQKTSQGEGEKLSSLLYDPEKGCLLAHEAP